jgi:hypothetical protein
MKIPEKFILLKDLSCGVETLMLGFLDIETTRGSVFKFRPGFAADYLFYDDITKTLKEVEEYTERYRIGVRVSERVNVFRFLAEEEYIIIISWTERELL